MRILAKRAVRGWGAAVVIPAADRHASAILVRVVPLGDHQDAVVAEAWLRRAVTEAGWPRVLRRRAAGHDGAGAGRPVPQQVAIGVEGRQPQEAHELAAGVTSGDDEPILAAGGVLWRPGDSFEILLIHRPRYDDWTLPKGKVDAGDVDLADTRREVHEETGLRGRLGADLGEIHYTVRGRPKVVRYWAMELTDDAPATSTFEPNHEVDELAWPAARRGQGARLPARRRDRRPLPRLLGGRTGVQPDTSSDPSPSVHLPSIRTVSAGHPASTVRRSRD